MNSPGKNSGVGSHFLLQGIFPAQGLNPCLLCLWHWQVDSLLSESPWKPPKESKIILNKGYKMMISSYGEAGYGFKREPL